MCVPRLITPEWEALITVISRTGVLGRYSRAAFEMQPQATELHRFCCSNNAPCHPPVPLIERAVIKLKILKLARDIKGNLNMDILWVRASYMHVSRMSLHSKLMTDLRNFISIGHSSSLQACHVEIQG